MHKELLTLSASRPVLFWNLFSVMFGAEVLILLCNHAYLYNIAKFLRVQLDH